MPQNAVLLKQGLQVGRGKTLDMFVAGADRGLQRPCLGLSARGAVTHAKSCQLLGSHKIQQQSAASTTVTKEEGEGSDRTHRLKGF